MMNDDFLLIPHCSCLIAVLPPTSVFLMLVKGIRIVLDRRIGHYLFYAKY